MKRLRQVVYRNTTSSRCSYSYAGKNITDHERRYGDRPPARLIRPKSVRSGYSGSFGSHNAHPVDRTDGTYAKYSKSQLDKIATELAHRENENPLDEFDGFWEEFQVQNKSKYAPTQKMDMLKKTLLEDPDRGIVVSANLRKPHLWYPLARSMQRKIIYHVGPTNSGKTFHALNSLASAKNGVYCGPLRLLASEVYEKLNNQGVLTNLMTGQQQLFHEGAAHIACTVEMMNITKKYDVVVIDEIQMIEDPDRGWGWTRAVLGSASPLIHVCGNESAVEIVKRLAELCKDEFEIVNYERLSPLLPAKRAIMGYHQLEEGDCVVAFSRKQIFNIKLAIESQTNHKCCIVYGSLPPETRSNQASLFNDQDNNYTILVASDAIGMGLNLNIRRVILSTVEKFDGLENRQLKFSEIKQIVGRAGRFAGRFPEGIAAATNKKDLQIVRKALASDLPLIHRARLKPTFEQLQNFCFAYPEHVPFSKILNHFWKLAQLDKLYLISSMDEMIVSMMVPDHKALGGYSVQLILSRAQAMAECIDCIKDLTLEERYTFLCAPVDTKNSVEMGFFFNYTRFFSKTKLYFNETVPILVSKRKFPFGRHLTKDEIKLMESLHHVLDTYLWLSYKFEDKFVQRDEAREMQQILHGLIETAVTEYGSKKQIFGADRNTPTHKRKKPSSRSEHHQSRYSNKR